ncbi:unnamed protein product [Calicophoron daubneyi]|uniref:IMD domain-containing protein n=1 Tax=Calicophoron daubneyi TaxID=300641 RepID=A0AAV2TPB9_CALDB
MHDSYGRSSSQNRSSFNFTSQLANLKNTLSYWEDIVSKTTKLNAALRTVIQCIAGFLEAFQRIADSAYSSNCGLGDLGSCMTRFCLRERGLESRLRTFNSQLVDCLAAPLSDRLEEWRRTVAQLERENNKEWRRARNELQRATCEFDKLNKRFRRKGSVSVRSDSTNGLSNESAGPRKSGENVQLNFIQHDLALKQQTLAELERVSLRRAVVEERRRYAELITCLKPVLDSQLAVFNDSGSINDSISAIIRNNYDPNDLPNDTEQAIENAVEQVSARITSDRKLSDVRSAMRFGKNQSSTGFDVMNYSRSTLSGHPSELSLQSAISTSTAQWSTLTSSAASNNMGDNHSSVSNGGYHMDEKGALENSRPFSPSIKSAITPMNPSGGDALSLFDNGEQLPRPPDTVSLGPGQSSISGNGTLRGGVLAGVYLGHLNPDLEEPLDTKANNVNSSTPKTGDEDDEDDDEGGGEGATTEDTEDGETEDEEKAAAQKANGKSHPILYPNQAIPAPVYTNLNELKRAAARKFSSVDSNDAADFQPSNLSSPSGLQDDTEDGSLPNSTSQPLTMERNPPCGLPPDAFQSQRATLPRPQIGQVTATVNPMYAPLPGANDGLISTCINSGTSTFRRRQSEYGKRAPSLYSGSTRTLNYSSMTPALVRRGSQACPDGFGRSLSRPAHPPRRSSSVSREPNHARVSNDLYAMHYPMFNGRPNGIDPGIQRVSSSIFTHSDLNRNSPNVADLWSGNRPSRPNLIQLPPGVMQPPSSTCSNGVNGNRSDRTLPLTPPPLATVTAPSYSKNNQLLFGIKVLPNQSPPTVLASATPGAGQSRLPQRNFVRQMSCEPAFSGRVPYGSHTTICPLNNRVSQADGFPDQRSIRPSHLANPQIEQSSNREDAVTSFIE